MFYKSKAVLVATVDMVGAVVGIFVVRFAPDWQEFAISLWAAIQPFALALIAHYAAEPMREVAREIRSRDNRVQ